MGEGFVYYIAGVFIFCIVMGSLTVTQWASQIHKEGHSWKESFRKALELFFGMNNGSYQ